MAESLPVAILIEDERQIRRFVRTALEAEGWSVHENDTLRQGLIDAGTRKPDLIILDLGLPDGDGMDFLTRSARLVQCSRDRAVGPGRGAG
jgi:two-component system KDP operon response regulator KdpE